MSASGSLSAVEIVPLRICRFELAHASGEDIDWVRQTLDRESEKFGARVVLKSEAGLRCRGDSKREVFEPRPSVGPSEIALASPKLIVDPGLPYRSKGVSDLD